MPPWRHKGLTREERAVLRDSYWQTAAAGKQPDECWLWPGPLRSAGYGDAYNSPQGERYAHRVAWIRANDRPIPDGLIVCHRCDNTLCVNPAHLFLGTYQQNTKDSVAKGRWSQSHRGARGPKKATRCKRGHLRNPKNTYFYRGHLAYCRICRTDRQRERRAQAGKGKPRRS